ncbi:MAG: sterol desaturase family protein [Bdellovibrionaceae bacterium]|nr:sterol desaturase family protein [Pseudobdellovibrionaceae bacterium]
MPKESVKNFQFGFIYNVVNFIFARYLLILGSFYFERFQLMSVPISVSTWIAAVVLVDFAYYWIHRLEHRWHLLWATHHVHHSSIEINLSANLRISWFEFIYTWIFVLPLILLGLNAVQVIICLQIVVIYQTWVHTKKIKKLPNILEFFLITPANHRVHHAINPEYIDKNFGGILVVWDRLFGTYAKEKFPPRFGLTMDISHLNIWQINIFEFKKIIAKFKNSKSLREALFVLVDTVKN